MFCDYCGDLLSRRKGYIQHNGMSCCLDPVCMDKAKNWVRGILVDMGQLFGPQEGGDGKEDKVDDVGGGSVPGNDNLYQTLGRRYEE